MPGVVDLLTARLTRLQFTGQSPHGQKADYFQRTVVLTARFAQ
jgi:hypothetical protein